MKTKTLKQILVGLCFGVCTLNTAQAAGTNNINAQKLETHVQSLNELTERRRVNTLYKNEQSLSKGLQHNYVNVGQGNVSFVRRDVVIKSRLPTIIARVYDSSLASSADFGQGWQLTLSETITPQEDGTLTYIDGSASQTLLIPSQSGYALSPETVSDIKKVTVLSGQSLQINYQNDWQKTFVLMDSVYRLTKINDAHANAMTLSYQDVQEKPKISKITGHNGHFVNITRDEQGRIITVTDDNRRQVSYQYNKKGQLSAVTDLGNNIWQYEYQGNGLLRKLTDPQGNIAAAFSYGERKRVTSAQIHAGKHRYSYRKNQTMVTDLKNNTTIFVQNKDGITVEVTNPRGEVSTVELNKDNQVVKLEHNGLLSGQFTFDEKGRTSGLKRRKQDGQFEQLTYLYDDKNRLIGVSNNNITTGQTTFNEQNQPTHIQAEGTTRSYSYSANGDVIRQTEGDINRTFEYNTDGLLSAMTENGKGAVFDYDKTGRMTSVTFPNGNTHHYQYDGLGFRTTTQRSDNSAITYNYDSTGNLRSLRETKTNGDIVQKDMTLDENNKTKALVVDGNDALDITYSDTGNPSTIVYNGNTVNYQYDSQNRLIKVDEGEGEEHILTYQYKDDEDGLRIQRDNRSSQINSLDRQVSQSAISVNSLYTRSKGTVWQHVMFNEQLGKLMLVNDKGYIPADADFRSSYQRRRLYNAVATNKRDQRSFDKPSSSAYTPSEYQAVNCGPLYCLLYGVILDPIGTVHVGDSQWISALAVYDNECIPSYTFAMNSAIQSSGFLNGFLYTFDQAGTYSARVNVACSCGEYYKWGFGNYTVLPILEGVNISTPSNTIWTIDQQRNMPNVAFTASTTPSTVPLQDVTFHWYLTLAFTENGKDFSHRIPASGTVDIKGANTWSPAWGNLLAGGNNMTVNVSATYAGHTTVASPVSGYQIHGENPTQAQMFGVATTVEARAICWKESSHRQFTGFAHTGSGLPVYGAPDGWGLMQKDPLLSEAQLWNWHQALTDGVAHMNANHAESLAWMVEMRRLREKTTDPADDWTWDPRTEFPEQVWNDAFARYNTGNRIYIPDGTRDCSINTVGCTYSDRVRGFINNPPW